MLAPALGGSEASAGLREIRPLRSASFKARFTMVAMYRTVRVESPPRPSWRPASSRCAYSRSKSTGLRRRSSLDPSAGFTCKRRFFSYDAQVDGFSEGFTNNSQVSSQLPKVSWDGST